MSNNNSGIKDSLLGNTLLSIFSWGFPLCLAFIATPILVTRLGNKYYGIYALGMTFLTGVFSTGIGKLAAKYVPEFRAAGKSDDLSEALSATVWLTFSVGILQASVLALAAPYLVSEVFLIEPGLRPTVVAVLYLSCFGGVAVMFSQIFQYVLQGLHRFGSFALITNLNALILSIGNIFLVVNGYGVPALLFWNSLVSALTGILFFVRSRMVLPELRFTFKISRRIRFAVARYAGSIMAYQALTSIFLVFERSWITRSFGTEILAFYVIPATLAVYMHGFLAAFVQVIFPLANELLGNIPKLVSLYHRATKVVFAVTVFIAVTYITSGEMFLELWVGREFAVNSHTVLVILSVALGINAISLVVWLLAEVFRISSLNALSSAIWMGVSIPLMLFLAGPWGIEGIAFSRLVGIVFSIPLIFYIEKRCFGENFWTFWLLLVARTGFATVAIVLILPLVFNHFDAGWIVLAARVFLGGGLFCGALFMTGFLSRDEIELARGMLLGFLGRKSPAINGKQPPH